MTTLTEYAKKRDIYGMLVTSIITALGFVVGLFWNDAIRAGIETVIPIRERLSAKFMAALIVTIFSIVGVWALIKAQEFREVAAKHMQRRMADMEKEMRRQKELIRKQQHAIRKKKEMIRKIKTKQERKGFF
ncbi:MAG: hypothetical protein HY368_00420 [Candidatus Aenigmarchaeota archaeon]|nr:hypothetical protein [Candidatus Aenigmarchaeota archaeon]